MKAIIFDLDGTLVSVRLEYRYELLGKVLARFGKRATPDEIDSFWFMHSRDRLIERWGIKPESFWKEFRIHDLPDLRKQYTFAYDDYPYLKELKNQGFRLALCTGSPPHIAEMELSFIDRSVFDVIVIALPSNGIKAKPDPMGALQCLNLLNTAPHETLFVGNSDEDILTARNAGIQSVIIDRKEHRHSLTPDRLITSLYEL